MSILDGPLPGLFHRAAGSDLLIARIGLAGGVVEAAALDALAVAMLDVDASHLQLTAHRHLEVHGIAARRGADFGDRLVTAGLVAALTPPVGGVRDGIPGQPRVGWFDVGDGLVCLGTVTAHARLSAEQARYAAAIGVPVVLTRRCELLFDGLTEAVAETVVRVLAPLGFIFDATSEWA